MVIRHILLKRKNNMGSVVDIVSVWKVLSVFCIMFVLLIGCGEPNLDDPKIREKIIAEAIDEDNLQTRKTPSGEELRYAPNQERPYAGWVKRDRELWQFQNGKPNGLYISWFWNGQNSEKGIFRNGEKVGLWTEWHDNGQKWEEGTYKEGKKNGRWTEWDQNGEKLWSETYTDGKGEYDSIPLNEEAEQQQEGADTTNRAGSISTNTEHSQQGEAEDTSQEK